jgi:hypothetical protein
VFEKLRALIKPQKEKPKSRSGSSRELKTAARADLRGRSTPTSREVATPSQWLANFEGFRHMMKDFSRRLEAIRENPEETYFVNTEVTLRVLDALEKLSLLTERNTTALETLASQIPITQRIQHESYKKRRAREVLTVLERCGALTYEELRRELKPQISYNRVTALVSEMIRDGIPLEREGKPVTVSLRDALTGSN